MAALTLATLIAQVRDLVGDQAPAVTGGTNNTTFTDTQITDAVNYACQDLCVRNGYSYMEADIAVTTPFQQYPMVGVCQDYLIIRRVMLKGSSSAETQLLKSSEAEEDIKNPAWRQLTADMVATFPRRWVLKDGKTIWPIPTPTAAYPSGTTVTLTVGYIQQPSTLVNMTDTVDARIPFPVQIYLKYAAASWLKEFSGTDQTDLAQAAAWMKQFLGYIGGE